MTKKQTNLDKILKQKNQDDRVAEKNKNERIKFLENEIKRHRDLYYNKSPEISDAKYDALEDELRQLDSGNPLLYKIGMDSAEIFTKREHIIPMGSQDKVTNPQEFKKWAKDKNFKIYLIQYKLDGISIELQYTSGVFQCAITRGDGKIGDDVTRNVMKMKGYIPTLKSRFTGATRAEILLFHDMFERRYSDKQNCRNAAAGIVRRKDGEGCEDLSLIFYDAISLNEVVSFENELDKIKWLKYEGFPTVPTKRGGSIEEVVSVWENVMNNVRATLEYDIDGLVIKGKEIDMEDMKRTRPMKQIAFKFQAEEIDTTVLNVEWSISGHIYTPVAIVEPVRLMGTTVSRASLANPNLIEEMGLKIGSEVMISKRGDIIPKIESVIQTPENAKDVKIPEVCETCNTKLVNEGTRLYCPNEDCPKRAYHRLIRWLNVLDVKNFSEKLILRRLFDQGKVRTVADLYKLKISDLTIFEGVQEKSAKKALENLYSVKDVPLHKFIAGFDIENIGELIMKKIVDAGYDTLDKIKNAKLSDLIQVEGLAEITAKNVLEGIEKIYPQMKDLLNANKIQIQERSIDGKLKGLSFCFTGKLNTMKRSEAEELVIQNGGETKNTVVKNLSYLVTNEISETSKFLKAKEQGTKIITEKEFLELLR
jgi:DNA ligase (NAD+)